MKKASEKLHTRRLTLTVMEDAAVEALVAGEHDPHMKQAYAEMLAGAQAHPEDRSWYAPWVMTLKDGTRVGDLCFKGSPAEHAVEIGYGVEEAFHRKGYATEAVKAMCDWAFNQTGVYYVEAEAEPDNEASIGVLGKCGFADDGEGREGRRYLLRKPDSIYMTLCMSCGLALGISFGSLLGSVPLGMSMGMCLGLAIGAGIDAEDKRKRQLADQERQKRLGQDNSDTSR